MIERWLEYGDLMLIPVYKLYRAACNSCFKSTFGSDASMLAKCYLV